jgi:hypothetical protein
MASTQRAIKGKFKGTICKTN